MFFFTLGWTQTTGKVKYMHSQVPIILTSTQHVRGQIFRTPDFLIKLQPKQHVGTSAKYLLKIVVEKFNVTWQWSWWHTLTHCTFLKILPQEKKKEIWLSPMTKTLTPTENPKTNGQHKIATKNFDYITIADRLRTVSWSNNSSSN